MLSRRNFFITVLMMAVLLFMFQFSQLIKENGNDYETNEYVDSNPQTAEHAWRPAEDDSTKTAATRCVYFLAGKDSAVKDTVTEWCIYTKRELICRESLAKETGNTLPGILLIDGESISFAEEKEAVFSFVEKGVPLIFCTLPEEEVVEEDPELKELLGITEVRSARQNLLGIRMFDGFLIGGEAVYKAETEKEAEELQDLTLTVPWYVTGRGSKTYITGLLDENSVKREDFPRIIWRNTYEDTFVFAVNGDYLTTLTGLGILDAFVYEMQEYTLYPVVNAQNIIVTDFPDLSEENNQTIQELYSRDADSFARDIMWPGILAMSSKNNLNMTCFLTMGYEKPKEIQPDADTLVFYLQQLKEAGAEAGLSIRTKEDYALQDKVQNDSAFLKKADCDYHFAAMYAPAPTEELRTALSENALLSSMQSLTCMDRGTEPLLSYYTDRVTLQGITADAKHYTYSVDLESRSLATALAYSNTILDMHPAVFPETEEEQWEKYFNRIFSNVSTYFHRFSFMEDTTLSESDSRVRTFLNLSYEEEREGNTIALRVSGSSRDSWFLLRTHGEKVTEVVNGDFTEVEQNTYLVKTHVGEVRIRLEKADEVLTYKEPFVK